MSVKDMKHNESVKRIMVLLLGAVGLAMQTAVYAWLWFNVYYELLHDWRRYNLIDGELVGDIYMGRGITYSFWGHVFTLLLYFALLIIFTAYISPLFLFLHLLKA